MYILIVYIFRKSKYNRLIVKLNINMNKDLNRMAIESDINQANYPTLFKGIWTGVLISLIVHQFINH